jgi:hypothetical protein
VTEDILTDVANVVGQRARAKTYGAGGELAEASGGGAAGIAINRAS